MHGRALAILALVGAAFTLSMFYRVSATVISPALSADLGLDVAQLGDLSAAFFYAFAASQIPLGLALDRLGPRLVMTACAAVGIAGAILFALSTGYLGALLGRILMGVGMSMNLMGPLALIAAWFPANRFAQVTGLLVGVGTLGQVLAATPLALAAEALGWRGSFLGVVALNLVQAVALAVVVRDRPPGQPAPPPVGKNPLSGLVSLLRLRAYWIISLGTFFRYGAIMSLQGLWIGPFVIYGLGEDPVVAGNALLFLSVGYMVGLPVAGRLSDQVFKSRKWLIVAGLTGTALMVLSLGLVPRGASEVGLCALFLVFGIISAPGQVMYAHIKELVPPGLAGTSMTGINLYTMLGSAVLMQVPAWLMSTTPDGLRDPAAFWPVWLLLAGGLLLASVFYLFLPDTRPDRS